MFHNCSQRAMLSSINDVLLTDVASHLIFVAGDLGLLDVLPRIFDLHT